MSDSLFDILPIAPTVSFEFFPPKSEKMETQLWEAIRALEPLQPDFVSVTYGAGGSTRERTHNTVTRILRETSLTPAAHLTCVAASRSEVDEVARQYWQAGVRHIVALRGDPPEGATQYEPHPDGYAYAVDLVAGLKQIADFEISVAAYPEVHPEAASPEADMDNLKAKIDAGATRVITQFFFDPIVFIRWLEKVRSAGITVPVVPGLVPVINYKQIAKFSKMCGAHVPGWLGAMFEGLDDKPEIRQQVAMAIAVEQCRQLVAAGVDEFHFYTLNRAELTYGICHMLGLREKECR